MSFEKEVAGFGVDIDSGIVTISVPVSSGSEGVVVYEGDIKSMPINPMCCPLGKAVCVELVSNWADKQAVFETDEDAARRYMSAIDSGNAPELSKDQNEKVTRGYEQLWLQRHD